MNVRLFYQSYVQARRYLNSISLYCSDSSKFNPFIVRISNGCVEGRLKGNNRKLCRTMATTPSNSEFEGSSNSKQQEGKETRRKPGYKVNKEELKARLSPIQYQVTQLKSTER